MGTGFRLRMAQRERTSFHPSDFTAEELDGYLTRMFHISDENKDGVLQPAELTMMLSFSKFNIPADQISQLVSAADTNQDGVINYDEFVPVLRGLMQALPMQDGSFGYSIDTTTNQQAAAGEAWESPREFANDYWKSPTCPFDVSDLLGDEALKAAPAQAVAAPAPTKSTELSPSAFGFKNTRPVGREERKAMAKASEKQLGEAPQLSPINTGSQVQRPSVPERLRTPPQSPLTSVGPTQSLSPTKIKAEDNDLRCSTDLHCARLRIEIEDSKALVEAALNQYKQDAFESAAVLESLNAAKKAVRPAYLGYSSRPETSAAISRIQARHNPPPSSQPAASCPDTSPNVQAEEAEPACRPASSPIRAAAPCIDDSWRCMNCFVFSEDPRSVFCSSCGTDRYAEDECESETSSTVAAGAAGAVKPGR